MFMESVAGSTWCAHKVAAGLGGWSDGAGDPASIGPGDEKIEEMGVIHSNHPVATACLISA